MMEFPIQSRRHSSPYSSRSSSVGPRRSSSTHPRLLGAAPTRSNGPPRCSQKGHAVHCHKDEDVQTLFNLAAEGGTGAARVIRQILVRGLPPDPMLRKEIRFYTEVPIKMELSPLQIACAKGHAEVVAALLDAGADANLLTGQGQTPLHLALMAPTKWSRRTICTALLLKGADRNIADSELGETPAVTARRRFGSRAKIFRFLRSPPDLATLWADFQQALPGFGLGIQRTANINESSSASSAPTTARTPRHSAAAPLCSRALLELEEKSIGLVTAREAQGVCGICLESLCGRRRNSNKLRRRTRDLSSSSDDSSGDDDKENRDAALSSNSEGEDDSCLREPPIGEVSRKARGVWQLPCNGRHMFHAACVKQWLRISAVCPTCRGHLP